MQGRKSWILPWEFQFQVSELGPANPTNILKPIGRSHVELYHAGGEVRGDYRFDLSAKIVLMRGSQSD